MFKTLSFAAVAALLPASVAAQQAPLREIEVRNIVRQEELELAAPDRVFANQVATMRAYEYRWYDFRHAARTLLPVIEDVDVRAQLAEALGRGIGAAVSPTTVRVTTTPFLPERSEEERRRAALAAGAAFINVTTEYELSVNSLRLEMRATAELYQAGRRDPVFKNVYYYQSEPVAGSVSAVMLWAADNGALYRRAIAEGADELARMIALDAAPGAAPAGPAMTLSFANGSTRAPDVTGTVVSRRPGRIVLRADAGGLYSFAR